MNVISGTLGVNLRAAKFLLVALVIGSIHGCASSAEQKIQKWEPKKRAQAHVELGLDYLKRGQFDTAREELDVAISIDPASDQAYHGKGLLLAQTGYTSEAQQMLARAVRINPKNYVAANDYGIYLCRNGEHTGGIKNLNRVESKQDNLYRTNTLLGLGICHFQMGDLIPAKGYFIEVLESAPGLPQALLPMAEISFQQQNFLSARAFIERYISVGAISERALVLGATTEIQLDDVEKARQYFRELRRVYPSSKGVVELRSLLGNE